MMKKIVSVLLAVLFAFSCFSLWGSAAEATADYNNVILMIGDGMGENHLKLARQERNIDLFMDTQCDIHGNSKTRSHSNPVTDSAAGGTALSSGVRTNNGCVAVYHYDEPALFTKPVTLAEQALKSGRRSGVVTTDYNYGATPASFTAHAASRKNYKDISRQQVLSDFDLIWGGANNYFNEALATRNGFKVLRTAEDVKALKDGERSFGQFDYDEIWKTRASTATTSPTLSEMTDAAIQQLQNPNGFFLMVEGAHIDKWSHTSNKPDNYDIKVANAAEAVEEFDHAIEAAVNFARKDGNTLVVITADHETGGIIPEDGKYKYTKEDHSAADVPLLVFGSKDFVGEGEAIDNYLVSQRIATRMGFSESEFPAKTSGRIVSFNNALSTYLPALMQYVKQVLSDIPSAGSVPKPVFPAY